LPLRVSDQTRKRLREPGLSIRHRVLGDGCVDRAQAGAAGCNRPLHALLSERCCGAET
jgi:hypothetical protein